MDLERFPYDLGIGTPGHLDRFKGPPQAEHLIKDPLQGTPSSPTRIHKGAVNIKEETADHALFDLPGGTVVPTG